MPPTNRRPPRSGMPNHSGLARSDVVLVDDIEQQILAQARGVTRKNIPCDAFRSIYLSCFGHTKGQPNLDSDAIQRVGRGDWEQNLFFKRLREALPNRKLKDLKLSSSFSKTLLGSERGKEPASQPDFFLHVARKTPTWADVELLFEHTQSSITAAPEKFLQWLHNAWNVFYHQPFRRHLYGILFLQPYALVCYADRGCAGYSEPLDFRVNPQHNKFLMDFLEDFIAEPEHRGRDPTITVEAGKTCIQHAGMKWAEVSDGLLCYRPSITGRNVRVARVVLVDFESEGPEETGEEMGEIKWVMKNAWEEKLQIPSPPPEEEILRILDEANVRGLPQLYQSHRSTDDDVEVETREFPEGCENALGALTGKTMARIQNSFISSNHTPNPANPGASVGVTGEQHFRRVQLQKIEFNKCIEVRRRLTRIVMSYCQPLKEAMRNAGPKELVRSIRDAMIVYYEAYKHPKKGFLHGDISIENIVVPVKGSQLTGGLTYETRRGTLIDWNLCFNADGTASGRSFRSGTPAFVAPILLEDTPIARRTLRHDMESFFAVILWVASLNYEDEVAFQAKPLVAIAVGKKPSSDIANAKIRWFGIPQEFKNCILRHFEKTYRKDRRFIRCVRALRRILYQRDYDDDIESLTDDGGSPIMSQETNAETDDKTDGEMDDEKNNDDPMEEGVFRECMAVLDDFLGDEGKRRGTYQLKKIDAGEEPGESGQL